MQLGNAYLITWIDSTFIKGWQYPEQGATPPEPGTIKSLGWLVAESENYLTLASHDKTTGLQGFLNPLTIPRGCVIDFEEIHETS